jgi:hypothetical protein
MDQSVDNLTCFMITTLYDALDGVMTLVLARRLDVMCTILFMLCIDLDY